MARHWSDGRLVAIRGDVPGRRFDPADSIVLRTPEERLAAEVALGALYDEVCARQERGELPPWIVAMQEQD